MTVACSSDKQPNVTGAPVLNTLRSSQPVWRVSNMLGDELRAAVCLEMPGRSSWIRNGAATSTVCAMKSYYQ